MIRNLALICLLFASCPSFAAAPFCVRDSHGEMNFHFDALFDSAAQNPNLTQDFSPTVLQGIFLRMKNLAARDSIFSQKLKDTWCQNAQNTVTVKDLFLTDSEKKSIHEDQEQISMSIHLVANLAGGAKPSELSLHETQVISHDAQGSTHLLSDNFELESFK